MKKRTTRVNFKGKPVPELPALKKPEWGEYHFNSTDPDKSFTEAFFDKFRDNNVSDEDGFDKTKKDKNGEYKKPYTLKRGTLLSRFGKPSGSFTTEFGAKYEQVGLPYFGETCEYHVYRVVNEIAVMKGVVAPIFDSPGGAVQYHHPDKKLNVELAEGNLEEVFDYDRKDD